MTPTAIAFLGESMIEIRDGYDSAPQSYAGDTVNTAIYLKRLWQLNSNKVSYITGLGEDSNSQGMIALWLKEKINTDLVFQFNNLMPGIYRIKTDELGEREFSYDRSNAAARYIFDHPDIIKLKQQINDFQYIFLSGISVAILPIKDRLELIELLKSYKEKGGQVIFDNNYRNQLWESPAEAKCWFDQIIPLCDICMLSYDDEIKVYGQHSAYECLIRISAMGVNEIILKRGGESCFVSNNGHITENRLKPVTRVIDSTAAGDSFNAGYLASRLTGSSIEKSIATGHKLASAVIAYPGAIIPTEAMPDLAT